MCRNIKLKGYLFRLFKIFGGSIIKLGGLVMNDGFINEDELIEYINNNTFNHYNNNIKDFLTFIFNKGLNTSIPFKAEKIKGLCKPDICISHNDVKKYVSIKKGSGNSVHQEKIDVFFPFIEDMLGRNVLNNLKKFHYGDDTIDDTGVKRYSASECKKRYIEEIKELNKEFNKWPNLIQFLNRFLFIGNVSTFIVDVVYHGSINSGVWASRDEIINYIKNNTFHKDTLHFGPLTYQVWGRDEKRKAVHPERRYVMQVKWSSITKDLQSIREGI